jgi:TolA-binding protein
VQSAVCEDLRSGTNASPLYDDEIKGRVDGVREQGQQLHDVKTQISILQNKLVSLKEEKHQLFQQLKTVLNEEDEKKKVKDEEQKHSEHVHVDASGDVGDHREGQDNVKRYPAQSPCPSVPSTKQQQQRGPLLPTPEFSRHSKFVESCPSFCCFAVSNMS